MTCPCDQAKDDTERSFTTGRTPAEQEAWVNSQDPDQSDAE